MVTTRFDRGPDYGRCSHSQSDGLCNDCGTSCTGGTLHRVCADDYLRGAWDISASQREYNHNDCDSYGKQSRQGSWWGCGAPDKSVCNADTFGGCDPGFVFGAAAR